MNRRNILQGLTATAAMPLLLSALAADSEAQVSIAGVTPETVYELRIYHAYPGKLEPLLARFRGPERKIFERLDMHPVAYWTATDDPLKGHTLIYMLRHKSRAIADQNWDKFRADPEWIKVKAESEANGAFVEKHESTFMSLTDFSPKL